MLRCTAPLELRSWIQCLGEEGGEDEKEAGREEGANGWPPSSCRQPLQRWIS
jgi:hypothetical protein